jgi:hypothetical protein
MLEPNEVVGGVYTIAPLDVSHAIVRSFDRTAWTISSFDSSIDSIEVLLGSQIIYPDTPSLSVMGVT